MQIQLSSVEDELQCTLTEGWQMCLGFQKHSDVLAVLHQAAGVPGGLLELLAHGPSSTSLFSDLSLLICHGWEVWHKSKNQTGFPGHLLQNKFSRPENSISQALRSTDCWCRMTPNFRVLGS